MDEEIDRLWISVRADTAQFTRDMADLRSNVESGLGEAAERAGGRIEAALTRSLRTGRVAVDDLKRMILGMMNEMAAISIGAGGSGGAGAGGGLPAMVGALLAPSGFPGRATGGMVSPGNAYLVGERGPELFVPATSGNVVPNVATPARDIRISINLNGRGESEPAMLARSARQIARSVRAALEDAGR